MNIAPYPHITINVEDQSVFTPVSQRELPLHRPLYFTAAEKGPLNIPVWCPDYNRAAEVFGEKTFDPLSNYYTREAAFLRRSFPYNGAFVCRIAPDSDDSAQARKAAVVVEAHVTASTTALTQFETDEDGKRILDSNGDPIPVTDADGNTVTVPGYEVLWTVRPLRSDEDPEDLSQKTVTANGVDYETYPMFVFHTSNPGKWGNSTGFALFYDTSENDPDMVERVGAPFYTFAPIIQENGVTTTIKDVYNTTRNSFIMKPNVVDEATGTPVSLDSVVQQAYDGTLPYLITAYNDNFRVIGAKVVGQQTETELVNTWSGTVDGDHPAYSEEITLTDASSAVVGETVQGTGIAEGTTITEIDGNTISLSDATTAAIDDAATLTIGWQIESAWASWVYETGTVDAAVDGSVTDSTTVPVDDATGIKAGDLVDDSPADVPAGTLVISVDTDTNTLTLDTSVSFSNDGDPISIIQEGTHYKTSALASEGDYEIELTANDYISNLETGMAVDDSVDGIQPGTVVDEYSDNGDGTYTVTVNKPLVADIASSTVIIIANPLNWQLEYGYEEGWRVNILSGIDPATAAHYQRLHVVQENDWLMTELSNNEQVMRPLPSVYHRLRNGADGEFQENGFELKLVARLEGTLMNPDGTAPPSLEDASRFPFNYLFDVGYTLDTKEALIEFQGIRGDVRTSVGAYIPGEDNDKLTNMNTGMHLREHAVLQKESELKATPGCRTSVWPQSGKLVDQTAETWYPATIWDAVKHAEYQNRDFLDQEAAGLPNSRVEIFREWNWLPTTEDTKRRFWNEGLNYAQYYNMNQVHFPAVRSVYDYETSVLVNNTLVDALVYTKQALRAIWHEYSGVTIPFAELSSRVEGDVTAAVQRIFNGKYEFNARVYQTDYEQKLGYVTHIALSVTAPGTTRVFQVDIMTNRENFEG